MPIKVLHVIESLGVGGMENGVVNIVNSIGEDFPSTIYCSKSLGALAAKVLKKDAVFYQICDEKIYKISWQLLKYCIKNKPDIIHTHSWGTLISGYLVCKILRIKLIHGEHGTVYFNSRKNTSVQKYILSRTSMNLFVSQSLCNLFTKTLNLSQRMHVIHNGVDINRFKKIHVNVEDYLPGCSDSLIIGTVGRLMPVKNHLWLINALSGMLSDKIKLVIIGDGELSKEINDFIKLKKLENHVVMYGESSTPELLMNCFDVFVLPSISEGLSNTILEAMSCELPIVAADVGGNSELVSDHKNGFLYESNNEKHFIDSIVSLTTDENKRQCFSKKSKVIVDSKFSLQIMLDNYKKVYTEAIK